MSWAQAALQARWIRVAVLFEAMASADDNIVRNPTEDSRQGSGVLFYVYEMLWSTAHEEHRRKTNYTARPEDRIIISYETWHLLMDYTRP